MVCNIVCTMNANRCHKKLDLNIYSNICSDKFLKKIIYKIMNYQNNKLIKCKDKLSKRSRIYESTKPIN